MKPSRLLAFLAPAVLAAAPLAAQVGHGPGASPYRDILHGNGWTITVGQVYGDGGPIRLSPNSGRSVGVRYDVRLSGLMQGYAGIGYLATERMLLAPDDSVAKRFSGPVDQTVWTPEIGLQLNLTGPKTWHHMAPFVAAGLGAAVGEGVAQDTTSFTFGTKLLLTPSAGVRLYFGQRVHARVEGLLYYWKMKYPITWTTEPEAQPSEPDQPTTAPIRNSDGLEDWIATPSLRIGIGIAF